MAEKFDPERFLKKPMSSSREKIIVAAFDLFHAQGIEGTSVDDILKKSGTGKSQFYHYFKSKDGLVHALMDVAYHKVKNAEIVGFDPIHSWDDLHKWFYNSLEKIAYYDYERCCPIGRMASQIEEGNDHLRMGVLRIFEAMKDFPKQFFIEAKARGELKEDADPESLATFCISVIQGASLFGRLEKNDESMKSVFEHAFAHVKSFEK